MVHKSRNNAWNHFYDDFGEVVINSTPIVLSKSRWNNPKNMSDRSCVFSVVFVEYPNRDYGRLTDLIVDEGGRQISPVLRKESKIYVVFQGSERLRDWVESQSWVKFIYSP